MERHEMSWRPTPSMAVALVSLFIALGSVGWAANTAKKDTVTSKSITAGAVKTSKLADEAVKTSKLAPNSVDGSKVADNSLNSDDLGILSSLDFASATSPSSGIDFGGDTNLYRSSPGVLATDGRLQATSLAVKYDPLLTNVQITPAANFVLSSGAPDGATIDLTESFQVVNTLPNTVELFARDNGGTTQLVAMFAGNDPVVLATDPVP